MELTAIWSLVLQVGLPLLFLSWLGFTRPVNRLDWLLRLLSASSLVLYAGVVGLWLFLPWFVPYLYGLVLVDISLSKWNRVESVSWGLPQGSIDRGMLLFLALSVVMFGLLLFFAIGGWIPPEGPAVRLSFPLEEGLYYVANGGNRLVLNPHMNTLDTPSYRGQSYAVDLVGLNRYGFHASGIFPDDPDRYAIFGRWVLAPCDGTVVERRDGLPDDPVPQTDRERREGNFVMVRCGDDVEVLLAHLRRTSLRVEAGESVTTGDTLAQVGNSGYSSEPHLHVHAQRAGGNEGRLSGEPLPVLFGGDYLVRNELEWVN